MRCYSHLSDDEREQIGLAKALGHSIGAIAQAIGRPKSTISRELSRNKLPSGRYSPLHAAGAYQLRRRREALIERDRALRTFVVDRLAEGWTPEQISGWLKGGNERRLRAVSCETIYAFIYRAAQRAEQLWRYLTRRHKRRRPRRSRPSQDTIKDRVSIHERPKTVDGRTEGGHWEGDLIICKRTRPRRLQPEVFVVVADQQDLAGKSAAQRCWCESRIWKGISAGLLQPAYRNARAHLLIILLSTASPLVQRMMAANGSAFLSKRRSANLNACRSSLLVRRRTLKCKTIANVACR